MDSYPTMDQHTTLNMLMDSLFNANSLKNWSIFEDSNENIIVRLRFTKQEDTNVVPSPQSFRRKSDAQVQRDRDRAARHRSARTEMVTRSRAATGLTNDVSIEEPRHIKTILNSETGPLEISHISELNASAESFSPESVSLDMTAGGLCADNNDSLLSVDSIELETVNTSDITETHLECEQPIDDVLCASVKDHPKHANKCKKIRCMGCHNRFTGGTAVYNIKMMRCEKCKVTMCEDCYEQSRHYSECRKWIKILNS